MRRGRCRRGAQRQVEAVDRVEEEQRADALVEVVAGAAEAVERLALGEQLFERQLAAQRVERAVALLAARRVMMPVSRLTGAFLPRRRAIRDRPAVRASAPAPARGPGRPAPAPVARSADRSARRGRSGGRRLPAPGTARAAPGRRARRKASARRFCRGSSMTAGVSTCMPKKQR